MTTICKIHQTLGLGNVAKRTITGEFYKSWSCDHGELMNYTGGRCFPPRNKNNKKILTTISSVIQSDESVRNRVGFLDNRHIRDHAYRGLNHEYLKMSKYHDK